MIKIWDNHNKQWLEPMSIHFGDDGIIWKITAKKPGDDPLSDGWYDFDDNNGLEKVAIIGDIKLHTALIPKVTDKK